MTNPTTAPARGECFHYVAWSGSPRQRRRWARIFYGVNCDDGPGCSRCPAQPRGSCARRRSFQLSGQVRPARTDRSAARRPGGRARRRSAPCPGRRRSYATPSAGWPSVNASPPVRRGRPDRAVVRHRPRRQLRGGPGRDRTGAAGGALAPRGAAPMSSPRRFGTRWRASSASGARRDRALPRLEDNIQCGNSLASRLVCPNCVLRGG
jgi:hypothetical protein